MNVEVIAFIIQLLMVLFIWWCVHNEIKQACKEAIKEAIQEHKLILGEESS